MKVLVSPSIDPSQNASAAIVRQVLGVTGPAVVSLPEVGVPDLSRPLTQAEVARIRAALRDDDPQPIEIDGTEGTVGYVCRGTVVSEDRPEAPGALVAVTDHVNLTWRSPLTGRNDDSVGPRFPNMTGIYAPEAVLRRAGAEHGIIVKPGVVAGVHDHEHLTSYESASVRMGHHLAASSELVPIAIVAAHMGLRIAAVVTTGSF